MKKKVLWTLLAAFMVSILVAWLQLLLGRQILLYCVLLVAAFVLGWLAPVKAWLSALILVAGNLLLHFAWSRLHFTTKEPFSWVGDLVLPVVFYFPAAFFGAALGWMHTIVKDDF